MVHALALHGPFQEDFLRSQVHHAPLQGAAADGTHGAVGGHRPMMVCVVKAISLPFLTCSRQASPQPWPSRLVTTSVGRVKDGQGGRTV